MKILYDHQTFTANKFGGVSRYFYHLITVLRRQGIEAKVAIRFSNNEYLNQNSWSRTPSFPYFLGYRLTNRLFSLINRLWSSGQVRRRQYDLFHPTFFHPYFLKYIGHKPFVLTYHDAIKDKFGAKYGHVDNASKAQKQLLFNRAAHIIAVSENTKNDLIELFQLQADKITVIHHATHFRSMEVPDTVQIQTPSSYLLYVGSRESYKNFGPFLQALAPLLKKYPSLHLVCGGGGAFTVDENRLIDQLGISDQVVQYMVNDLILYRLYQQALAFIYPSLYEGFGIPILEAFATGCPVVVSHTSCFPEVAQDAALYFDPESAHSIRQQVEVVLFDAELRQSLRQKGYRRQEAFSSEQMVHQTLEVYHRVLALNATTDVKAFSPESVQ
ncbi:glycosyltransferase [Spirosoma sp. HMF4905]|uniref:Glycosyltransferase n=1 Tax=Spirosoma arboris TaxID=2682092 RepID=A0A7K1SLL6_9BACT|nr:glycosyltransferase family 1 protein [Spirosoma arboris]MVM34573.1 glycosyltransferase [Spirosoma arboris]